MEIAQFYTLSRELLAAAETSYLTTLDNNGYPHTRAVFNLRNTAQFPKQAAWLAQNQDGLDIFIGTNTSSVKVAQIRHNPKVSIYYCIPSKFQGLMFSGDIEVLEDPSIRRALWNEGWERYYSLGVEDPDYTILRLKPRSAEGWYQGDKIEFAL